MLWELCIGLKVPWLAPDSQFWFQNEHFARKTFPLFCIWIPSLQSCGDRMAPSSASGFLPPMCVTAEKAAEMAEGCPNRVHCCSVSCPRPHTLLHSALRLAGHDLTTKSSSSEPERPEKQSSSPVGWLSVAPLPSPDPTKS